MSSTAGERVARSGGWMSSGQPWFLANFGILYGIAYAGTCVAALAQPDETARLAWLWSVPAIGLLGLGFTFVFTLPAFTLYLIGLRLARRRWPRRLTAWLLTPLLTWAVLWTWPTDGESSWWNFGIALTCIAAAAALVRI